MAYVITESCIGTKNTACVGACPVDCIYDADDHFIINPAECIDCSMCMPECPVEAIYPGDEVPEDDAALHEQGRRVRLLEHRARRRAQLVGRHFLGDNVADLKQRSLEEVKALSVEEAVEIMRQAGIVGAGGGGFPTYFKYKAAQPHLLVNATESEPGYWGDKLVHKETSEEFLQLFEAMKAIFEFEQISMCVHEKDREWFADYAEHADDGVFDMRYVPNTYALGEEKTLVKHATDTRVPRFVDNPDGIQAPGDAAGRRQHRQQLGDLAQRLQRALPWQAAHHQVLHRLRRGDRH